jgi:predicted RNA-binding Zn-ribbon protein involved in translation (DUF1610 family)
MRLESEGIPVFMLSLNHASAFWLISGALGGIQLQVPPSEVARAREILELPELPEAADAPCPECGSANVRRATFWRKLSFLSVHFLSIPLPFTSGAFRCKECGHVWEP